MKAIGAIFLTASVWFIVMFSAKPMFGFVLFGLVCMGIGGTALLLAENKDA